MSKHTVTVNSANWDEEVLHSPVPVLVDFWAPWCAPCRMIAPAVEEVAAEYAGRAKVVKLNVDDASDIAGRYGIQSIPTLLVFRDGRVAEQQVGARPKAEIARLLSAHVAQGLSPAS